MFARSSAVVGFRTFSMLVLAAGLAAAECRAQTGCSVLETELMPASQPQINQKFGAGVVLSDDGLTAAISSASPTAPDVAIYQKVAGSWNLVRQLATPFPGDGGRYPNERWGGGLEMSGDGRTLLMLPIFGSIITGVTVIDQNPDGTWPVSATTAVLPSGGGWKGQLTTRVTQWAHINKNGSTVIVGDPGVGMVRIYERTPGVPGGNGAMGVAAGPWVLRAELSEPAPAMAGTTETRGAFGSSVRVSADGSMAAVVGLTPTGGSRICIYRRSAATGQWALAEVLTPAVATEKFEHIAMSGDGRTIIGFDAGPGLTTRTFRNRGSWVQFVGELGYESFERIALTPDGSQLIMGGTPAGGGGRWPTIYREQGNAWTQAAIAVYPADADLTLMGASGARWAASADGQTVLVGNAQRARTVGATQISNCGRAAVFNFRTNTSVISQPASAVVSPGGSATMSFGITSTLKPLCQWRRNNVIITDGVGPDGIIYSGSDSPVLSMSNIPLSEHGAIYDCTVLNACSVLRSEGATMNVVPTVPRCLADLVGAGEDGLLPDGTIDGNDFIAFINAFAAGC